MVGRRISRAADAASLVLVLAVYIFNLVPGSIVLEIDQERRMVYLHVIDVGSEKTVARFYRQVERTERLLIAAFERDKMSDPCISTRSGRRRCALPSTLTPRTRTA